MLLRSAHHQEGPWWLIWRAAAKQLGARPLTLAAVSTEWWFTSLKCEAKTCKKGQVYSKNFWPRDAINRLCTQVLVFDQLDLFRWLKGSARDLHGTQAAHSKKKAKLDAIPQSGRMSFFCLMAAWLNEGRCPGGRPSVSTNYITIEASVFCIEMTTVHAIYKHRIKLAVSQRVPFG